MNCRIFSREVKKLKNAVSKSLSPIFFLRTQSHRQTSLQNANKINKEKYVVIQVYLDSRELYLVMDRALVQEMQLYGNCQTES